jgi:acetyl/propionyl-CoA carboxylase alpha subunit
VPPDYDPLLAKIMTVGRDRPAALRRMRRALDEVEVSGIQTTLPFDRALVREPAFLAADDVSTDWVPSRWDGAVDRRRVREVAVRAAAVAFREAAAAGAAEADETSLRKDSPASGWRRAARQAAVERWPR